jgi:hypothetical protein
MTPLFLIGIKNVTIGLSLQWHFYPQTKTSFLRSMTSIFAFGSQVLKYFFFNDRISFLQVWLVKELLTLVELGVQLVPE